MKRELASGYRVIAPRGCEIWRCACVLVLLAVLVDVSAYGESDAPVINTKWGLIRGKWSKTLHGRSVANFLGIPYALPPVGDLRFKNPLPWNRTWTKIRDATTDGEECMQLEPLSFQVKGSEDCLNLNIFMPADKYRHTKLPVIFFIFGGGFSTGSSTSKLYAPDYLLDRDVILVTLNYRVNALGFFSTVNQQSPGNYGLKDILMGLKWVQENIHYFDGDSGSVTVIGSSSGGASINLLAWSNKTHGLIHRYILYGGSAVQVWSTVPGKKMREYAVKLAKLVGCLPKEDDDAAIAADDVQIVKDHQVGGKREKRSTIYDYNTLRDERLMECMRHIDARKLVGELKHFSVWQRSPRSVFGPTLEDKSEDAVLTEHPITIMRERRFHNVPIIITITTDEGLFSTIDVLRSHAIRDEVLQNFDYMLPYMLEYQNTFSHDTIAPFNAAVRNFYFNDNLTANFEQNVTDMVSDACIRWHLLYLARSLSAMKDTTVYLALFGYHGTFSFSFQSDPSTYYGVAHNDDLNYCFPVLNNMFRDLMLHNTERDITMIHIVTEMWANFAKTGVPKAKLIPEWPKFRDHQQFMRFGIGKRPDIVVQSNFMSDKVEFWSKLMLNMSLENDPGFDVFVKDKPEKLINKTSSVTTHSASEIIIALTIIRLFFFV